MTRQVSKPNIFWAPSLKPPGKSTMKTRSSQSRPPGIVSRQAWPISNAATMKRQAGCAPHSSRKWRSSIKTKPHNHKPLPGIPAGVFREIGGANEQNLVRARPSHRGARLYRMCWDGCWSDLEREFGAPIVAVANAASQKIDEAFKLLAECGQADKPPGPAAPDAKPVSLVARTNRRSK